ncbi:hypothetical protein [Zoogloea sp.]|uniref:hypothetical protein n=1 Tax=Zoogloea sp. TaxID=49181 RepID=UPI0035B1592A
MTNTIATLAQVLAMSANITAQEVERVARWQEDAGLIEPLRIDADAFQRALKCGDETLPEGVRTIITAGLVEGLHVVWGEGRPPHTLKRGRADWLLRRISLEGSPFGTVARLFGLSRASMAQALSVSQWQVRKLYRPDWVEIVHSDHDELLARLGMLLAKRLDHFDTARILD